MRPVRTSVFCWPAIERMQRIHRLLENQEYPNCVSLAREFEMSVRTLKRDVEFMRTRLHLPIAFDAQRNGYVYTRPVRQFPQVPLSEADLFTLFVASKAIAQYRGTPLQQMLETTFRKLTGQLDASLRFSLGNLDGLISFRPFAPGEAELQDFDVLMRAVNAHRVVRFRYRNRGQSRAQERRVHPYHIGYVDNQWCLFGFDADRRALRTFVLGRLREPRLTRQRFAAPARFDVNEYLAGSLGLYRGRDDYEVVVELDAWAADDLRGRRLHASQELIELPGGMLRVRLRLDSLEEVEGWVLSLGSHATVIRPDGLRARLAKAAEALRQRYGT